MVRGEETPTCSYEYNIPKEKIVHEKDKKRVLGGLSIAYVPEPCLFSFTDCCSTGPIQQKARTGVKAKVYDAKDPIPYVSFVFKYRSRGMLCVLAHISARVNILVDFLEAQDLIPRRLEVQAQPTPPPVAGPSRQLIRSREDIQDAEDEKPPAKRAKCVDVDEAQERKLRMRKLKVAIALYATSSALIRLSRMNYETSRL